MPQNTESEPAVPVLAEAEHAVPHPELAVVTR